MSRSSSSVLVVVAFLTVCIGTCPNAWSQLALAFTTVDVQGATQTAVTDIDGLGDLIGFYRDSKGLYHGFRDSQGTITRIDFPGAIGTWANGIDLNDVFIVGWYTDSKLVAHGFRLTSGKFSTVDVPGARWTRALAVNSLGTIVGAYADTSGRVHGFLDDHGLGKFTTLDFHGAVMTQINSIVNLRYMAGSYVDSAKLEHGLEGADGMLGQAINFPGAVLTTAQGVNNAINIVGYYKTSLTAHFHGYLLMGGQFQKIDFPGATDTRCNGISDSLQIVGRYTDTNGKVHGFLAK